MDDEKRLSQNRETFATHKLAFMEGRLEFLNRLAVIFIRLSVHESSLVREIEANLLLQPANPYDPATSAPFAEQFDAGWNEAANWFMKEVEHLNST